MDIPSSLTFINGEVLTIPTYLSGVVGENFREIWRKYVGWINAAHASTNLHLKVDALSLIHPTLSMQSQIKKPGRGVPRQCHLIRENYCNSVKTVCGERLAWATIATPACCRI